jgi:tetratricopeptide (TPR) repeat protein
VDDAIRALSHAEELLSTGVAAQALRILTAIGEFDHPALGMRHLLALARANRQLGAYNDARAAATAGLTLAYELDHPAAVAVLLEALGLIEAADGRIQAAGHYFWDSADIEWRLNNADAAAAALGNYANMLIREGCEGAERLLQRAFELAEDGSMSYAATADNMAAELARQGRYVEAAAWGRCSVEAYERLGAGYDAYVARCNQFMQLDAMGDIEAAAEVFEQCYDYIFAVRREELDIDHYRAFPQRVAEIEARSAALVATDEIPGAFAVGILATLGEERMQKGLEALAGGRLTEALGAFDDSRDCWDQLGALHCIVRVDCHRAACLHELGDRRRAVDVAAGARSLAHHLGDAKHEAMAIASLVRGRPGTVDSDALDQLACVQALDAMMAEHGLGLGARIVEGAAEMQAAAICREGHAYALAERYILRAIELGRALPPVERHRQGGRLFFYLSLLAERDDLEGAERVLTELSKLAEEVDHPLVGMQVHRARAMLDLARGEVDAHTLTLLIEECASYEQARTRAGDGREAGFASVLDAPYARAAAVALELGDVTAAFALSERGKARSLSDDLGVAPSDVLAGPEVALPEMGAALGLSLLVGRDDISLFVLDGGTVRVRGAGLTPQQIGALRNAAEALTDAADDERRAGDASTALDGVLHDHAFGRIGEMLREELPRDGRPVWLAPHSFLHRVPLQLVADRGDARSRRALPLTPTLAVARVLGQRTWNSTCVTAVGDPTSNLRFARAEAMLLASEPRTALLGQDATLETVPARHLQCRRRGAPLRWSWSLRPAAPRAQWPAARGPARSAARGHHRPATTERRARRRSRSLPCRRRAECLQQRRRDGTLRRRV